MHNTRNQIKKILGFINHWDSYRTIDRMNQYDLVNFLKVRLIFFSMMLKLVYILIIVIPKLDNAELPMWDRIKVVIDRWYIYIA